MKTLVHGKNRYWKVLLATEQGRKLFQLRDALVKELQQGEILNGKNEVFTAFCSLVTVNAGDQFFVVHQCQQINVHIPVHISGVWVRWQTNGFCEKTMKFEIAR